MTTNLVALGSRVAGLLLLGLVLAVASDVFLTTNNLLNVFRQASLTFLVPPNPALVGGSLYWQAVIGPPLRFTNLETTTVTGL